MTPTHTPPSPPPLTPSFLSKCRPSTLSLSLTLYLSDSAKTTFHGITASVDSTMLSNSDNNGNTHKNAIDVLPLLPVLLSTAVVLAVLVLREGRIKAPGPPAYPVIGCLFSMLKHRKNILEWFTELLLQSPSQTIVVHRPGGLRVVITANPANVEHMLKTRFENYPKGPQFSEILGDLLGKGIFNVDGDSWMLQRKLASFQFSTRSLRTFIVHVVKHGTHQLLDVLQHKETQRLPFDLQDVFQRFSFGVICKVSFGIDCDTLHPSMPLSAFAEAFDTATELSALRDAMPLSSIWKLKRLLKIGSERRLAHAISVVHAFADDIVRRRLSEMSDPNSRQQDLLSRFLTALDGDERETVLIRDMVVSFLLAGRDTTSSALTWFFWLLSAHPHVENKICAEINRVAEKGCLEMDYDDLQKMDYLHAALCEAMRLYPPVPIDSKHAVCPDVLPDGTLVNKGDRVTYHPYAMGRMPSIWGSNCLEYRPERWLSESEGTFVGESPYRYSVFQAGLRICLGRDMAFIQMKYVAASVIGRFRIVPAEASFRPTVVHCLTARMAGGFPVVVSNR